jgi:hypothetical protein
MAFVAAICGGECCTIATIGKSIVNGTTLAASINVS